MRKTCLNAVFFLAKRDERVVFVGSDLGPGVLDEMKAEMPERFFMEGISEQHVIGMAAGLALEGFIPFVNTIATFISRRAFDQVAIDLCMQNLPVRLIGNGGGVVYAPLGATHLAIEDIAILRTLPNMTIVAPADAYEMSAMMEKTLDHPGPIYIRLGKGGDPIITEDDTVFEFGCVKELSPGRDVMIFSTGIMSNRALDVATILKGKDVACGVVHCPTVKTIDGGTLRRLAAETPLLITLEEHVLSGGFGSTIIECLLDGPERIAPKIRRFGLPDAFPCGYGSQDSQLQAVGLGPEHLAAEILRTLTKSDRG